MKRNNTKSPNNHNLSNPNKKDGISTKSATLGAKEVPKCFNCDWPFPDSFRGEEKNTHIDRCLDGRGGQDIFFWKKCKGDMRQYRYSF